MMRWLAGQHAHDLLGRAPARIDQGDVRREPDVRRDDGTDASRKRGLLPLSMT
jgi:hypothetical protein